MEERFADAWKHRWEANKYGQARVGDHLITPFECDRCIFIKLKGRLPIKVAIKDRLLLAGIRRVNLGALWGRETSTVKRNLAGVKKIIYASASAGLVGPFILYGPMPAFDYCGYEIAIDMVLASRSAGRYCKEHTQFDTIRKLRTVYANFERISSVKVHNALDIDGGAGEEKDGVYLATSSIWFRRFVIGCKARMGQVYKPNLALTTKLITSLLGMIEEQIKDAERIEDQFELIVFGSFIIYSCVLSLRGDEGTMVNLASLVKYRNES